MTENLPDAGRESADRPAGGEDAGRVLLVTKHHFFVQTGKDILKVNEVQLQGKKRMPVASFLLGYPLKAGCLLGE